MDESISTIGTKQRQAQEMSRRLLKIIDMALAAADRADTAEVEREQQKGEGEERVQGTEALL